jgi:hypothetical protein
MLANRIYGGSKLVVNLDHVPTTVFTPCESSHAETTLPHAETTLPHAETTLPRAETTLPHAETTLPHAETTLPHAETSLPHAETSLPRAETTLPHAETTLPHAETTLPLQDINYECFAAHRNISKSHAEHQAKFDPLEFVHVNTKTKVDYAPRHKVC